MQACPGNRGLQRMMIHWIFMGPQSSYLKTQLSGKMYAPCTYNVIMNMK